MNEPFILEINYQDQILELPAAFQRYGYTYRIAVSIADIAYVFEPDEAGNYQALKTGTSQTLPDTGLLQAIAEKLQKL
ncbi:hypothetical protein [Mucilaginibacter sp. SG564]|uniref:hypothetical protein n=1 Tax=unclassified Mucilaginibacter TaxID=2617802 RepID=UPI001555EAF3|nr:hypothetical protein [Mucilaginibacter sp. SG564]NOW98750.1 hypothetical protein [Mucilaginibacter sp. SG564]